MTDVEQQHPYNRHGRLDLWNRPHSTVTGAI